MTTVELLGQLRGRDAHLSVRGNRLAIDAPAGAVTPDLLEALRQQKEILLEVIWRADEMRKQIGKDRAIPLLTARDGEVSGGRCVSCGDLVGTDSPPRCGRCIAAAVWVLDEWAAGGKADRGETTE